MSGLDLVIGDAADFLIQDSIGRRTGFDSTNRQAVNEIPQSAHFLDAIADAETGSLAEGITHSAQIFHPGSGTYTVIMTGVKTGLYTLAIRAFSQDGSAQPLVTVQGIAGVDSVSQFEVRFNPAPGATPQAERVATFSSTLGDIDNALQLELIKNQGVSNSLSTKIKRALAALSNGNKQASRDILGAFLNEVAAAGRNKHITALIAEVLTQDAQSLSAQTQ